MKNFKNKYSGIYLNKILLELLKEFNIKFEIIK